MNALRLFVVSAVSVASIGGLLSAEQTSGLAAQHAARVPNDNLEKERALGDLGAQPSILLPNQVSDVLGAGLVDPSGPVRERALWAIAQRTSSPPSVDVWRQERVMFSGLRGRVHGLLNDSDTRVSLAAIAALCALDLQHDKDRKGGMLSMDAASALERLLQTDTREQVRAHALRAFASYAVPLAFQPRRDAVVMRSLSGTSDMVVGAALLAVGNQRVDAALPLVPRLLTHPDRGIRLAAPQALAAFGANARAYLPDLQKALDTETDGVVRSTLEGAIKAINQ